MAGGVAGGTHHETFQVKNVTECELAHSCIATVVTTSSVHYTMVRIRSISRCRPKRSNGRPVAATKGTDTPHALLQRQVGGERAATSSELAKLEAERASLDARIAELKSTL